MNKLAHYFLLTDDFKHFETPASSKEWISLLGDIFFFRICTTPRTILYGKSVLCKGESVSYIKSQYTTQSMHYRFICKTSCIYQNILLTLWGRWAQKSEQTKTGVYKFVRCFNLYYINLAFCSECQANTVCIEHSIKDGNLYAFVFVRSRTTAWAVTSYWQHWCIWYIESIKRNFRKTTQNISKRLVKYDMTSRHKHAHAYARLRL